MIDELKCSKCRAKYCAQGIVEESTLPSFCPMKKYKKIIQEAKIKYENEEIEAFYKSSVETEIEAYDKRAAMEEQKKIPVRSRTREIAEFALKMGYERLGLAFCKALSDEALRATLILEKHGLEINSIACSCGALDRNDLNVPFDLTKGPEEFQFSCNPIVQAELLNRRRTSFNILVGLCIGHDMLFSKHCTAPVTTLIVKDRVSGHNPVISLYTSFHKDVI